MSFVSLTKFLAALASFKVTDAALTGMATDLVAQSVLEALEAIKDQEVGGEDVFVTLLTTTLTASDLAAHKTAIMKHAATSKPVSMGDWDKNDIVDEYRSVQFRVKPSIRLAGVTDRLEIKYLDPAFDELTIKFDKVAVLYLRAARGLTT